MKNYYFKKDRIEYQNKILDTLDDGLNELNSDDFDILIQRIQDYKIDCFSCGEEMNYIEDKEMEKLGFISMDCPNGCDGGYLIPYNNPKLQKLS